MESPKTGIVILAVVALVTAAGALLGWQMRQLPPAATSIAVQPDGGASTDHQHATYDPIHFRPVIEMATDVQCFASHREVLEDKVRETSPAG